MIYWVSMHVPSLHNLFFPTIGAFGLLFVSRKFKKSELSIIALGAIVSSIIGSVIVYLHPGALALFINTLVIIGLMAKFKLNAPPILAISFVPFFVSPTYVWLIPLSVFIALLGLMVTLFAVHKLEKSWRLLPPMFKGTRKESEEAV